MQDSIRVSSALISVFDKKGLYPIVEKLHKLGVTIYSTGGTADYIDSLGVEVIRVESITDYPSILGGRVKTLHPKIHAGILNIRSNKKHLSDIKNNSFENIDLVIVNFYPFEKSLVNTKDHNKIIENIDIGGPTMVLSLIHI